MIISSHALKAEEAKWKCKCTFGYEGDPKNPALEQGSIEGRAVFFVFFFFSAAGCVFWCDTGVPRNRSFSESKVMVCTDLFA